MFDNFLNQLETKMTDEAFNAKVEAKVAKAKAKALRPWFKKKRVWLLVIIGLIVVVAATSGGGSESSNSTTEAAPANEAKQESSNTIATGLGSKDASDDVLDFSCKGPDALGFSTVTVKVMNHSSKASDYFVTITAQSADKSTKYDDTIVMILNLAPNQTMTEEGMFTNELPSGAVCTVTEVQRTAA